MFTVTFGQCNASLLNKSIHFLWKTLLSYILQKYSMLGSAILNIASFLFLSIELTHTWQTFRVFSHSDHCFLLLSVKQPIQVVPHTSYLNHAWFMNTCTNTCKILSGVKAKKNPEPELFSEGWRVSGVDIHRVIWRTNKQKTFENDFPWNYLINKLIKQNGTNKVLHMQRTQLLWQL